jgi:uncharacterized membrane protein
MSQGLKPGDEQADVTSAEALGSIEISSYSGPLPHPQILREFEEPHPGTAQRIFDNFFLQAQHRRDLELQVIQTDSFSQKFGAVAAAVVGFVGMSGGIWLAHEGRSLSGLSAIFATLASLVVHTSTRA